MKAETTLNSVTFDSNRTGKGTKEWSDYSYNICIGREHGCLYCYAKTQAARFKPEMRIPGNWNQQNFNPERRALGAEVGDKGVVMFPTSHDITPQFLRESLETIKNLLKQNQVLIVSKPHLHVVMVCCEQLADRKDDVQFRFTIGSLDKDTCAFWEPGAPTPQERMSALRHAFDQGFSTSVSIEPMLNGCKATMDLVHTVDPYVTSTIWIDKMQTIPSKLNAHVKGFDQAVTEIKAQQSDEEILKLVEALEQHPKVRWKDSIKSVIERTKIAYQELNQNQKY